ncbi:S1/P1 nuclease [Flavivirga aquimarina]|uniref:S1/P1 nuclease n=1 Tax=Flavivirga aquimarina TaxID=2027862 RepID=A0ABT8WAW9_9FLAO|nr:S1/P1 nuclease [Flavivirga aquimarina]MDO5970294.1 S1/P1 nuclease [Flavivirga aquimarina]
MIIAAISWEKLDANSKASVTEILKKHPAYEHSWKKEFRKVKNTKIPLGKFLMMKASIWSDAIRSFNHPEHEFHRGEWHYINYKINFSGGHDSKIPKDVQRKGNVVFAINWARDVITDTHTPDNEKAMYLAWLIHLVGDIHQPLHCGSLFSSDFPKGDRGGNKFFIKPSTAGVKLHSFWDGSLGGSNNVKTASDQAFRIINSTSANIFPNVDVNEKSPRKWSLESFEQAKKEAHLNGKLKAGTTKNNAVAPPANYGQKMKGLAEKKATLAGYRLASDINRII